jgi:hypothetical protein
MHSQCARHKVKMMNVLGPPPPFSIGDMLRHGFTKPANRASRSIFCY